MVEILLASLFDWGKGLRRSTLLIRQPCKLANSMVRIRSNFREAKKLLQKLYGEYGVEVATPDQEPVLFSRVSGFGNITTQIRSDEPALNPALIGCHTMAVRSRLQPLQDITTLIEAVHGVLATLPLVIGAINVTSILSQESSTMLELLKPVLLSGLASAFFAVGFPFLLRRLAVRVPHWLGLS